MNSNVKIAELNPKSFSNQSVPVRAHKPVITAEANTLSENSHLPVFLWVALHKVQPHPLRQFHRFQIKAVVVMAVPAECAVVRHDDSSRFILRNCGCRARSSGFPSGNQSHAGRFLPHSLQSKNQCRLFCPHGYAHGRKLTF